MLHKFFKKTAWWLMSVEIPLLALKILNHTSLAWWIILLPFLVSQVIFLILIIVFFVRYLLYRYRHKKFLKELNISKEEWIRMKNSFKDYGVRIK